jgi:TPP-dependent pyruvate/acetoin dehydrogenase alpha subunit
MLVAAKATTRAELTELESQIGAELAEAVAAARRAPWPDPKDLLMDVF